MKVKVQLSFDEIATGEYFESIYDKYQKVKISDFVHTVKDNLYIPYKEHAAVSQETFTVHAIFIGPWTYSVERELSSVKPGQKFHMNGREYIKGKDGIGAWDVSHKKLVFIEE